MTRFTLWIVVGFALAMGLSFAAVIRIQMRESAEISQSDKRARRKARRAREGES